MLHPLRRLCSTRTTGSRPPRRASAGCAEALESRRLLSGGTVSGQVFHDQNANGFFDDGEPALPGGTIYADLDGDEVVDPNEPQVAAAADASYSLALTPGLYTLRLAPPPGFISSAPGPLAYYNLNVSDNWSASGFSFGAYTTGTAAVYTFNDADGDAVKDAGEEYLQGRTIYLDANEDFHLTPGEQTRVTGADGAARFEGLKPGLWDFRQLLPPGWTGHGEFGNGWAEVTVRSGATAEARLGSRQPTATGTIIGTVYDDADSSRRRGAEEPALGGRTVYLDANDNGSLDDGEFTAITSDSGAYGFSVPAPGTWFVRQVVPDGWTQTAPTGQSSWPAPTEAHVLLVQPGQTRLGDFGTVHAAPASISGEIYNDADGDGAHDPGEAGPRPKAMVLLDYNNDGRHGTDETYTWADEAGRYSFPEVPPGTYTVRQAPQGRFAQTDPVADDFGVAGARVVTVTAGQNRSGVDFGDALWTAVGRVEGVVFEDVNGNGRLDGTDASTAGRTVYIDADNDGTPDPGERRFNTLDRGFTFDGLKPGTYRLRVIVPSGYRQTYPAQAAAQVVTLVGGQRMNGIQFGLTPLATPGAISGTMYTDVCGDGSFGVGDRGWGNQTVFIDANDDGLFQSATELSTRTLSDGTYSFTGLGAGTYVVRPLSISGYVVTQPAAPGMPPAAPKYTLALEKGQLLGAVDFGWVAASALGRLYGSVFDDANGDGTRNTGETSPAGRVVYLDLDGDGALEEGEPRTTQGTDGYVLGGRPARHLHAPRGRAARVPADAPGQRRRPIRFARCRPRDVRPTDRPRARAGRRADRCPVQ